MTAIDTKNRTPNLLILLLAVLFIFFILISGCKKADTKHTFKNYGVTITMTGKGLMWYEGNWAYGNPGHTGNKGERTVLTDSVNHGDHVRISCQADSVGGIMGITMVISGVATYTASGTGKQTLFYQN